MTHAAPASLLTIFGATGDLARRMLLPSLYSLQAEQLLPANLRILGTARSELDREGFANLVSASIEEFTVEGKSVFGLSVHSPLYKEMKGKKVGERFTYNTTTYLIKEIL